MRTLILLLALAFTGDALAQAAANPPARVKAVIDNIRNADTPGAQVTRVSERILVLAAPGQDTSGWTNTQKANAVLAYWKAAHKSEVTRSVNSVDLPAAHATIAATAAAAAADLD